MGILSRFFGRDSSGGASAIAPKCPHATLTPRWETADAIGKLDLVSRWVCEACQREFTPAEADRMMLIRN